MVFQVIFTKSPFAPDRRCSLARCSGRGAFFPDGSIGPRRPSILRPMTPRDSASSEITPEVLLRAYACGIFPMAETADDPTLFWGEPAMRGVIPLDRLRRATRRAPTVPSA